MSTDADAGEQLELVRAPGRRRSPRPKALAEQAPVAAVALDLPQAHLDRPFDYAVTADQAETAQPGVRVRVRFAGQDVDGYVLARRESSEHPGPLTPLRRVVSPEPVLTPQVLHLAEAVASRYAGSLADVLRLAVPLRHATAEQEVASAEAGSPVTAPPPAPGAEVWAQFPAGPAFLAHLEAGRSPRAVWTAAPGPEAWRAAILAAATATLRGGRRVLVVVPDRRDLDRLEASVAAVPGLDPARVVRLEADLGPALRYAAFLRALRGHADVVLGTRAAAFAPVPDLGLVVVWDDGDEQHAEPRAPYPHAREVLRLRADAQGCAFLLASFSRSCEAATLLRSGWARAVERSAPQRRDGRPRVVVADQDGPSPSSAARIPPQAWRAVQQARGRGPVLIQVPRLGYLPSLRCQDCRAPATCPHCRGPLRLREGGGAPECSWCGRAQVGWRCAACESPRLRAGRVGVERTAEELGRAFPGARVVVARADAAAPRVDAPQTLVLSTPGIEPAPSGRHADGYAAAVLLDGDLLLQRPDLRAAEDTLRRWCAAAALVVPAQAEGLVVVCADPAAPAVQALVRHAPEWFAERELDERIELGLPPALPTVVLSGGATSVDSVLAKVSPQLPDGAEVLGPVPLDQDPRRGAPPAGADDEPSVRAMIRMRSQDREAVTRLLRAEAKARSARRETGAVRLQVDPFRVG
ncbi:MAG: primosome assembly protein PriA [Kineosporiaceae bacterium]